MIPADTLDRIADHFVIAAIWADAPEGTTPRAARSARNAARAYVERFTSAYPELCAAVLNHAAYGWHDGTRDSAAAFGHDLYLTARGHGTGFWDRDALQVDNLGDRISAPLRDDHVRWYCEPEFYRGWLYFTMPENRA